MADNFGIVTHGFNETVVDSEIEVDEDSLFMAFEHPGEIPERLYSAVSCPPEPPFQILGNRASAFVVPELSEHFF